MVIEYMDKYRSVSAADTAVTNLPDATDETRTSADETGELADETGELADETGASADETRADVRARAGHMCPRVSSN